jgi:large subunit ribosomal protein L22
MKASLRNTRISPIKMNVIAELVRGSNAQEAITFLEFTPKKGAKILKKVIESALANATNNFKQKASDLIVKEIKVSKGFDMKRSVAGSRGRARPILKRSSHVHVFLDAKPAVEKKEVKPKATKEVKEKTKK